MTSLGFVDLLDVCESWFIDDIGTEHEARAAVRAWLRDGSIPSGGQGTAPAEVTLPPDKQRSVVIHKDMPPVTPEQVRIFEEMGGSMARKPSRRQMEMMRALANKTKAVEQDTERPVE